MSMHIHVWLFIGIFLLYPIDVAGVTKWIFIKVDFIIAFCYNQDTINALEFDKLESVTHIKCVLYSTIYYLGNRVKISFYLNHSKYGLSDQNSIKWKCSEKLCESAYKFMEKV